MKIGEQSMNLCIKLYGDTEKKKYSHFEILPYFSVNNKVFNNDIWQKVKGKKVTKYIKLHTSYIDAKNIAFEMMKGNDL